MNKIVKVIKVGPATAYVFEDGSVTLASKVPSCDSAILHKDQLTEIVKQINEDS